MANDSYGRNYPRGNASDRGKNAAGAIKKGWRWGIDNVRDGMYDPLGAIAKFSGVWALVLLGASVIGFGAYILGGKTHATNPIIPSVNPTDAGESLADRVFLPIFQSSTAPSSNDSQPSSIYEAETETEAGGE